MVHNVQMANMGPSNLLENLTFTFAYPQSQQVTPMKIVSLQGRNTVRFWFLKNTDVSNSTWKSKLMLSWTLVSPSPVSQLPWIYKGVLFQNEGIYFVIVFCRFWMCRQLQMRHRLAVLVWHWRQRAWPTQLSEPLVSP